MEGKIELLKWEIDPKILEKEMKNLTDCEDNHDCVASSLNFLNIIPNELSEKLAKIANYTKSGLDEKQLYKLLQQSEGNYKFITKKYEFTSPSSATTLLTDLKKDLTTGHGTIITVIPKNHENVITNI